MKARPLLDIPKPAKKGDAHSQLTSDGWVEIYDPKPSRQGYQGDSDATSEIHQANTKWTEAEDFSWVDPEHPWRTKDEHS